MSLYEVMLNERKGHTAADFGLQFALSEDDVRNTLRYLVPLFGDAIVRLMRHPQGLVALLGQIATPQHQFDTEAPDLFQNSRILANGTGLLSLLFHNEATMRVVAAYAAEGAHTDAAVVRRMLPYAATLYVAALGRRTREPLELLASRLEGGAPGSEGLGKLAEIVLAANAPPQQTDRPSLIKSGAATIRDILAALAKVEREEDKPDTSGDTAG